jgi:hypothetical protein
MAHGPEHFNAQNGDHEPPPGYGEDQRPYDPNECEYCGEQGTAADPIIESIISPPVAGYKYETMRGHKRCTHSAAADMVR